MIDILLSAYNGANYIDEQIASILNQTEQDWRLLLRDDGSTDRTGEMIDGYAKAHPGKIVQCEDGLGNVGVIRSFELLMEKSDAEYILFSDHDDVWLPEKIALTLREMRRLEEEYGTGTPLLVHTDLQVVDEQLHLIDESFWHYSAIDPYALDGDLKMLGMSNSVTGCTMMINRALKEKALPFPKEIAMHDAWLSIVAGRYGKVKPLGVATIKYRQHMGNVVGAQKKETLGDKLRNLRRVWDENRKRYAMTKGLVYHSIAEYVYYKLKDMKRRSKL